MRCGTIYIKNKENINIRGRSRGTARCEGSVRAGSRMVLGHIEYRDKGMSDDCLRDYMCGIVPMGEEVWCWCRKRDVL